jgi:hypothetical protein
MTVRALSSKLPAARQQLDAGWRDLLGMPLHVAAPPGPHKSGPHVGRPQPAYAPAPDSAPKTVRSMPRSDSAAATGASVKAASSRRSRAPAPPVRPQKGRSGHRRGTRSQARLKERGR